jgi:hypothetical protein
MRLKPGTRLKSAVCATEVVVVRAPADELDVRCGGEAMVLLSAPDAPGGSIDPMRAEGTLLGKRYADEDLGLELLCTKGGAGSLSLGDTVIPVKGSKPLPSSD